MPLKVYCSPLTTPVTICISLAVVAFNAPHLTPKAEPSRIMAPLHDFVDPLLNLTKNVSAMVGKCELLIPGTTHRTAEHIPS